MKYVIHDNRLFIIADNADIVQVNLDQIGTKESHKYIQHNNYSVCTIIESACGSGGYELTEAEYQGVFSKVILSCGCNESRSDFLYAHELMLDRLKNRQLTIER